MPTRYAKTPPTRRGFPVRQFKALDEAHGIFSGYLAVFGNEDQVWADPLATGDIIEPGAFTKTLSDMRTRQQTRVAAGLPSGHYLMPIFWEHDDKDPVGGFTALREDKTGLYFEAELDLDIEQGRRAFSGLTKGYLPGMSFGYFVVKAMYDRQCRRAGHARRR
jgi:Escherichia/Staphylococcus phage prohead protease